MTVVARTSFARLTPAAVWQVAVAYQLDIGDVIEYPSDPEAMEKLLRFESKLKEGRALTHRSMNGYVIVGENGSDEG
jgi:hypothetical protein